MKIAEQVVKKQELHSNCDNLFFSENLSDFQHLFLLNPHCVLHLKASIAT